jgi:hypothetical protein
MRIDIMSIPDDESIYDAYPELLEMESWAYIEEELILRYIILLYSSDGPLNKKPVIPLPQRKLKACQMVKLMDKGLVETVISLKDPKIVEAIFEFLRFMDAFDIVWREIVTTEQEITTLQIARMEDVDVDVKQDFDVKDKFAAMEKRTKFMKEVDIRTERLQTLYDQFFGDHEDVQEIALRRFTFNKNTLEGRAIENRGHAI